MSPTRVLIASSRSMLRSLTLRQTATRAMSGVSFNRAAPPPLSPAEQREFDELVRAASTPAASSALSSTADARSVDDATAARIAKGEELHPDARRLPKPDFEGDVNPVTGEQGGPKQEPLRHGDWSFGGRATDF